MFRTYDQYWVQANADLATLAQTEATEGPKVSEEREPRLAHFTSLYIKYVQIYNRLEVLMIRNYRCKSVS